MRQVRVYRNAMEGAVIITFDELTISEQLAEIAEAQIELDRHMLASILLSLAFRVRRMERALDEIVENAREEARIAEVRS